jgi:2TM domain
MRTPGGSADTHRWTHFFQHLRIFIYVMVLLLAIDIIGGTDDFFVHWVAGIWGAILAMHFLETAFFGGGLFGNAGHHQFEPADGQSESIRPDAGK